MFADYHIFWLVLFHPLFIHSCVLTECNGDLLMSDMQDTEE